MSKNSSINGNKHPYLRLEAWTHGVQGRAPLAETWLKRTTLAYDKKISPAEWMKNWLDKEEKANRNPHNEV